MIQTSDSNNKVRETLVFDTNIFLKGINFHLVNSNIYTTPSVIQEIEVEKYELKNRTIIGRIKAGIESKKLILKSPSEYYTTLIKTHAKSIGDLSKLSSTDIELIALTLELEKSEGACVTLYTDDYTMENLCKRFGIKYSPVFREGIKNTKP